MATDLNNILVFKTNIQTECDKQKIQTLLAAHEAVEQTNIDLHDVDCVLRIVTAALTPEQIISLVKLNGFECAELE
jgi:hypothetical protein